MDSESIVEIVFERLIEFVVERSGCLLVVAESIREMRFSEVEVECVIEDRVVLHWGLQTLHIL